MNNHYVPQFLLRQFEDKIYTYNIETKKTIKKNIKKSFSEENIYPEELEKKLSEKIEEPFSRLLQTKLLKEDKFEISEKELELIRKFLVIQSMRYNFLDNIGINVDSVQNYIKEEGLFEFIYFDSRKEQQEHLEKIKKKQLKRINIEEAIEEHLKLIEILLDTSFKEILDEKNKNLINKNIEYDSNLITTNNLSIIDISKTGEKFIIPDIGYVSETARNRLPDLMINDFLMYGDFKNIILQKHHTIFPDNFIFYPISDTRAICLVSKFFEHFDRNQKNYEPKLEFKYFTNILEPIFFKKYKMNPKTNSTIVNIKYISEETTIYLNRLMLNECKNNVGFSSLENIKKSVESYEQKDKEYNQNDYSELLKYINKKINKEKEASI